MEIDERLAERLADFLACRLDEHYASETVEQAERIERLLALRGFGSRMSRTAELRMFFEGALEYLTQFEEM